MLTANRICHQWGQHRCLLSAAWCRRLLTDAGFTDVTEVTATTSRYFDPVPSTHLVKFPGPTREAFALEACTATTADAAEPSPGGQP